MLYLATKPDAFLTALLDTALTDARSWAEDARLWRTHARHVVEGFPSHESLRTAVPRLQAAHRKPAVYRMSHFFWVLLYDLLAASAARHNARVSRPSTVSVETAPAIGPHRCGPIRIPSIVATFWWDLQCFPEAALDSTLVPPPAHHRARGGPERYAPVAAGLVEIAHPRWAANPDTAELSTPGLTVQRYPLFAAPATCQSW